MAEAEQLDETTIVEEEVVLDPAAAEAADEDSEEFEIVLAGEEDAEGKPEPKSTADHILNRVMRKKERLQGDLEQEQTRSADLQKQLLKLGMRLPIIFLTGYAELPIGIKAMKLGAEDSFKSLSMNLFYSMLCKELSANIRKSMKTKLEKRKQKKSLRPLHHGKRRYCSLY